MVYFYEMINNNGQITERSNLTPMDKIKIYEYEVERSKNVIKGLEEKLELAKKKLAEDIKVANESKAEAKTYLKDLLKEIK